MQNLVKWLWYKCHMSHLLHVTCHSCYMSQISSYMSQLKSQKSIKHIWVNIILVQWQADGQCRVYILVYHTSCNHSWNAMVALTIMVVKITSTLEWFITHLTFSYYVHLLFICHTFYNCSWNLSFEKWKFFLAHLNHLRRLTFSCVTLFDLVKKVGKNRIFW